MKNLAGKVALITGGSKGIGFGIAEALIKEGVHVGITSRSEQAALKAADELNSKKNEGNVLGIQADVRSFEDQQKAIEKLIEKYGRIDIVIANAGLGHFASIEDLTIEQWNETIDTNLTGPFFTLKATLDQLKENKGYYMTISSLAGTNFFKNGSAYNASKFGVTGFTQAAMLDLREMGIKTTTIMPGSVSTYFNGNNPDEADAWKIQIEDLGEIVVDLLKMNSRTLPSKVEVRPSFPK